MDPIVQRFENDCTNHKVDFRRLTLACLVLLLAMWVCAASGTHKWGPDLTLDLPPHLVQEALFGPPTKQPDSKIIPQDPWPSAPSELPSAPLLRNEQQMGINPPVTLHMNTAVRVLPPRFELQRKMKPVFYKFSTEEPA